MIGLNTNTSALPPDYDYVVMPAEVTVTVVCSLCCGSGSTAAYIIGVIGGRMPLCSQCGGSGVMTVTWALGPFRDNTEDR